MGRIMNELKSCVQDITQGKSMPIDEIVQQLKTYKQYRKTPTDILKKNVSQLNNFEQQKNDDKNNDNGIKKNIEQMAIFDDEPNVSLEDLGGIEKIKIQIQSYIDINIKNKNCFTKLGFQRSRKHILIKGPEGSGKTSLALAIAKEIGYPQVKLNLFDPRVFSTMNDNKISNYLLLLQKNTPCTIILDDLDQFFGQSDKMNKEGVKRIERQLLDFMDLNAQEEIIIIGVVHKIENIKQQFIHLGRFENLFELKIPEEKQREEILTKLLIGKKMEDINIQEISQLTAGFVGADLKNLIFRTAEISIENHINNKKALILKNEYFKQAVLKINPIVKREGFTSIPTISFEQIGALEYHKKELEKLILLPLKNPEKCKKFNIRRQAGILLYGPPGCGKTMLAKAVANACKANFIYVKGPELLSKYVGESEKSVRGLFERAKLSSPCLIFFDEIDGLCPKRNSEGNQVIERVVNQLLTELNGVDELEEIFVIGATNRPDIIDTAILRPERLGIHLYVPLPNNQERIQILKTILKKRPINLCVDLEKIEELFDLNNYTGADLQAFVEAAARNAAWKNFENEKISLSDFIEAYKTCKPN